MYSSSAVKISVPRIGTFSEGPIDSGLIMFARRAVVKPAAVHNGVELTPCPLRHSIPEFATQLFTDESSGPITFCERRAAPSKVARLPGLLAPPGTDSLSWRGSHRSDHRDLPAVGVLPRWKVQHPGELERDGDAARQERELHPLRSHRTQ